MQYMGGKSRQARSIVDIILPYAQQATKYVEPFLGGGSIAERIAPKVFYAELSDVHPDLVCMWQSMQKGWLPPTSVTKQRYEELRNAPISAERGFVGFGCSFGGKWFGGYASDGHGRDYVGGSARTAVRKSRAMRRAVMSCRSFADIAARSGDVIYCDPPYAGTTGYSHDWDADLFWRKAREWAAAGAVVFVSEYSAPSDIECVWSREVAVTLSRDSGQYRTSVERLYRVGGQYPDDQPSPQARPARTVRPDHRG
jgi:DNA adenine methylase